MYVYSNIIKVIYVLWLCEASHRFSYRCVAERVDDVGYNERAI